VVGAGPRLRDGAEGLLQDFVVHGADVGISKSKAPSDVVPAPRSSSTMSSGLSRLYLPGSPGFSYPSLNWRWVEAEAESACSQVAAMERLLHKLLASVHRNILCLVRVSLKRETKFCLNSCDFLHALIFPVFCSHNFYLGAAQMCPHCWRR
jgi:hypothetical protein